MRSLRSGGFRTGAASCAPQILWRRPGRLDSLKTHV